MIWFVLAASGGALVRHGVNRLGFAWAGTLVVNVAGSFLLGLLIGSDVSEQTMLVAGTAGCGSLTTFSMFGLETVEAHGSARVSIVVATVAATVLAAALGYAVA